MKLTNIKRISKEDMSRKGDVPGWMDPLLDTLNQFIENITQALSGNLTFEDNFLSKVITQEFTHATELIVSPKLEGRTGLRAYGVMPMSTSGEELASITWRLLENGNVGITLGFGSSVTAKCTLLILLKG